MIELAPDGGGCGADRDGDGGVMLMTVLMSLSIMVWPVWPAFMSESV